MGMPGRRAMYFSARSTASRARGSRWASGSGTRPVTGSDCDGLVPQVTNGSIAPASISTRVSYVAPESVGRDRQYARASSQAAPFGANGLPDTYANVFSSGAMSPARPPPSIVMLHTVNRPSIDSAPIVDPVYSMM